MAEPLVSLILCIKNGMPYLPEAIESVAAQNYRHFELIVQDAESTDGSLELFGHLPGIPHADVVSEPDGGIGDAYNRAVRRSRGDVIGSIDSDNLLEPDALDRVVPFLRRRPELAAVYGGSNMLAPDGEVLYPWMPNEFDLLRLLDCRLVPPFAVSFFSRAVCGAELRFDETLKTCADFDLWLRLSHLPIARMDAVLGGTRLSDASMTRRADTYDQYIVDKSTALARYLDRCAPAHLVDVVREHALAGLHLWAAESVYDIEGERTEQFERYLRRAISFDPGSGWAARIADLPERRSEPELESVVPEPEPRPEAPTRLERAVVSWLRRRQSSANSDV
jgi:hypothetical protein